MELTQQLESVFITKNLEFLEEVEPFILNRFISFHPPAINVANDINRFIFKNNKKFVLGLMLTKVPRSYRVPYLQYIKKPETVEHEMQFLLDKIKDYYGWSERELKNQLPLLLKIFEEKNVLREHFVFFGIDKKYYKKFELEFERKKEGLGKWF